MTTLLELAPPATAQDPALEDESLHDENETEIADEDSSGNADDAAEDENDSDDAGGDDDDADDETPNAAAEPAAPVDMTPIPPPEPRVIVGFVRGLAEMLVAGKGTLLLAIAKLDDEQILVTIQPPEITSSNAPALPPLQVKGTPAEIDEQLLDSLAHYVPAVEFSVKTAAQIAAETAAAATTARTSAATKKPVSTLSSSAARPTPGKTSMLVVKCNKKDAAVAVTDEAGKVHDVTIAKTTSLPRGKYTITVSRDGFASQTKTIKLTGYRHPVDFKLTSNVGHLTVKAVPKDATARVIDADGTAIDVALRTKTPLKHGRYTVEISAPNFEPQSVTAFVNAAPANVEVTLTERPPSLFEGV